MTDYQGRDELAALADRIDGWLAAIATGNPTIASIDRGTSDDTMTGDPRWIVRMRGDEKDITTVWLTLGRHLQLVYRVERRAFRRVLLGPADHGLAVAHAAEPTEPAPSFLR